MDSEADDLMSQALALKLGLYLVSHPRIDVDDVQSGRNITEHLHLIERRILHLADHLLEALYPVIHFGGHKLRIAFPVRVESPFFLSARLRNVVEHLDEFNVRGVKDCYLLGLIRVDETLAHIINDSRDAKHEKQRSPQRDA